MRMQPFPWTQSGESTAFWSRLAGASRSVLMLDYDGTLAPFQDDPTKAYPYPGIEARLAALSHHPKVRLIFVSGRPARLLEKLMRSIPGSSHPSNGAGSGERTHRWLPVEIWGNHGRERLNVDDSYHLEPLQTPDREALDEIQRELRLRGYAETLEIKPASVAVHWRTLPEAAAGQVRSLAEFLYRQWAPRSSLEVLPFDGGIELRPRRCNKGSAVDEILAEEQASIPAAYLGDDLTDEDAFAALGDRGISLLVRGEWRESAAKFWLRPPEELLRFLDGWIQACGGARS
jgi:trehalose-phosphatase